MDKGIGMFLIFRERQYVFVELERLIETYVRFTMLYPGSRELFWADLSPLEIFDYELERAEMVPGFALEWADNTLDWSEVPTLSSLPHLEEDWVSGNYTWRFPSCGG